MCFSILIQDSCFKLAKLSIFENDLETVLFVQMITDYNGILPEVVPCSFTKYKPLIFILKVIIQTKTKIFYGNNL